MAASCQVCELKEATVYCPNDDARLCAACDHAVHSASALAARHQRVALCEAPDCKQLASVFCKNDQAFLCSKHNEEVHSSNPLAARHTIVPALEAQRERQAQQQQQLPLQEQVFPRTTQQQPQVPHTAESMASDDLPVVPTFEDDAFSHSAPKLASPGAVPPALDVPLSMGMNKDALAKSIWGNEGFEMDANAWLDRLDMGFDFSDILGSEGAGSPHAVPSDNVVPTLSNAEASPSGPGHNGAAEDVAVLHPCACASPLQDSKQDSKGHLLEFPAVPNMLDLELDLGAQDLGEEAMAAVPEQAPDTVDHNPALLGTNEPLTGLGMVPLPAVPLVAPLVPVALSHVVPAVGEPQTSITRATRASVRVPVASSGDSVSRWAYTYGTAEGETLTREERVARYREKRLTRKFQKTIRYASRKAYAEVRPRIKGRFAKREEVEAWRAAEAAMAAGAAVVAGGDLDF